MTKRRKALSLPARKQSEAVFQSDLAMNLFMVLMVVLATLAASVGAITVLGFKVPMTSEQADSPPPLGLVASWQPVLPVSPRIVVRNGTVDRLDMDRLAQAFADGSKFLPGINDSGHLPDDADPSSYKIELILLRDAMPAEVLAWRIDAQRFSADGGDGSALAPFEKDLQAYEQFDVFVYPDQNAVAWDLALRLHRANKRFRLLFVSRGERFHIERASARFAFEDMYK